MRQRRKMSKCGICKRIERRSYGSSTFCPVPVPGPNTRKTVYEDDDDEVDEDEKRHGPPLINKVIVTKLQMVPE